MENQPDKNQNNSVTAGEKHIFGDLPSALSWRLGCEHAQNLKKLRLDKDYFNEKVNLYTKGEEESENNLFDMSREIVGASDECVTLRINPEYLINDNDVRSSVKTFCALGDLSVQGLYAYMTLAPARDIAKMRVAIKDQLITNSDEEFKNMEFNPNESGQLMKASEKYWELNDACNSICYEYKIERSEAQSGEAEQELGQEQ